MKGCTLAGRFRFVNEDKNARFYEKQARKAVPTDDENKDPQWTFIESLNAAWTRTTRCSASASTRTLRSFRRTCRA